MIWIKNDLFKNKKELYLWYNTDINFKKVVEKDGVNRKYFGKNFLWKTASIVKYCSKSSRTIDNKQPVASI